MNEKLEEMIKRIVEQDVIMCASGLVSDLLGFEGNELGGISWENVENLYYETEEEAQDYGYDSLEAFQESGEHQKEIFEWWFVSKWLYEKLQRHNEAVLDSDYGHLWGRTCTGQAISMDWIMRKIAQELLNL